MIKKFYATVLLAAAAVTALAQTHGNISFEMGLPVNDFREETDNIGTGLKGALYIPFQKNMPVFVGLGLGYMLFGTNNQEIHEVLEVKLGDHVIDEIPIDLLVQTNNNFFNAHVSVRYKAPLEIVQPYVEGRGGLSNFYTRTKVLDNTPDRIFTSEADNVITRKTQLNSTTWHYGIEGGFIIKLGAVGLNLGAAYLVGGRARYYDRAQISQWTVEFKGTNPGDFDENNIDPETIELQEAEAQPKRSTTDMLLINAGITFGVGVKKKEKKPAPAK